MQGPLLRSSPSTLPMWTWGAVAKEQEMKAYTQEMKAKVVEAEAQVPAAMAEALRSGNLGVMDYYRMNNINADTKMRKAISGEDDSEQKN